VANTISNASGPFTKGFITTRRVYFRTWREDDFDLAMALWGDPEVTRFIVAKGKMSEKEVRERLIQEMANQEKHSVQYWPCFLSSDDAFVGCCGIRPYDPSTHMYEIGFHLVPRCWGRGLAVEAAQGVMAYAFKNLSVAWLFAGHHPDNIVSPHVLKKLRFLYTHDEFYAPTGLMHPSYRINRETYLQLTQK
jgi:ribosomal-protein-alanine N-acetyltransferase